MRPPSRGPPLPPEAAAALAELLCRLWCGGARSRVDCGLLAVRTDEARSDSGTAAAVELTSGNLRSELEPAKAPPEHGSMSLNA